MVSGIAAWGVQWTGLTLSPKTDSDRLIKDNLSRYCPKNFEAAKGKREKWRRRESNPGPLAKPSAFCHCHNTHRRPPLLFPLLLLCSWVTIDDALDRLQLDDFHQPSDSGGVRPVHWTPLAVILLTILLWSTIACSNQHIISSRYQIIVDVFLCDDDEMLSWFCIH